MAQGLERIPLAIDSDYQAAPVRANFPEAAGNEFKVVAFEPDQPAKPQAPAAMGAVDTLSALGRNVWDAVVYHTPAAVASAIEGDEPYKTWDWKDALIERARERSKVVSQPGDAQTKTIVPGMTKQDVNSLGPSLGFSVAGAGAGLGAGVPAGIAGSMVGTPAVGTVAGYTAGMAASGKAAYNMATNQFVRDLHDAANEEAIRTTGKPVSPEAFAARQAELARVIRDYGLWEAIPEAAGNALGFGILTAPVKGTIGRLFGNNVATRFASKMGALYGGELATETVTQMGQHNAEVAAGMSKAPERSFTSPSDWGESLREVAAPTILQTTLMAGGFKAGQMAKDRLFGKKDEAPPDDAIPAGDVGAGPSGGVEGEFIPASPSPALANQPGPGNTYDQSNPALPPGQPLLPRPALPAPEQGGPTDRQTTTAMGLLKHSPKPSPELLQRLMRVDQTMAAMLFNHWQGQSNGQVAGSEAAEVPAQGDQGQGADIGGSGIVGGYSDDAVSFTPDTAAEVAAPGGEPGMAVGATGPDAITALDVQAHAAATSPFNATPQPTEAQKQAGNYAKGHVKFQGMDIAIENPAGSVRSGKDADGKAWENTLAHHYGYIKGTVGRDKDHLDVFIKPGAQTARMAYVIDQADPKTGAFDEHKIVLGADSEADAKAIYHANYQEGWQGFGAMTAMPMDEFKAWVKSGKTKKPLAYVEPKEVRTAARTPKAANSLLQAIVNRGGISREIMADVGGDPSGRYMPGLFTKTGTTDLSALAGYLFDEDGFHQIRQDSDVGPARELEDMIVRALGGEKILSTTAMKKGAQAEENAKLKEKAQRLGVKTVARRIEDIAADVLRIEAQNVLDEETALEDEALVAYNETVDALRAAYGDDDAESFLEDLASKYQDETHLNYLRNATIDIQEKINAQAVQSAEKPDETAASPAGQGYGTGGAQGGDRASGEEARPALALSSQSEAELAARDKAAKDAEAQRLKDEQAAENKRQADAERGSFQLTGSDRPADVLAAQGQGGLFESNQPGNTDQGDEESLGRVEYLAGMYEIGAKLKARTITPGDYNTEYSKIREKYGRYLASKMKDGEAMPVLLTKPPAITPATPAFIYSIDGSFQWITAGDGRSALSYTVPVDQAVIDHDRDYVPDPRNSPEANDQAAEDQTQEPTPPAEPVRNSQIANERQKDAKGNPIYKMGERVEYVDGQYKGRHGAISQVSPIRMVTVMLGSGARNEGETTYYYHVKTDNGADFMASPEEIRFEESKPESVVPDIAVDGMVIEPRRVLDGIGYAKRSAEGSRAAAQRARKASSIADHKRQAATQDEKAARYQAAWDAWAAKYPAEAEKLAPKPAAKPAAPVAGGSASAPSGDVLKAAGLKVTKTTTKNGKPVWEVGGNTREHSDMLKRLGGGWYGPKKVWSFYNDDPTPAITLKLGGQVTIAGTPTIQMPDKSLEQIAASSQPAAVKAQAELDARDQADEVDLGALFDEVLAEETAPKKVGAGETAKKKVAHVFESADVGRYMVRASDGTTNIAEFKIGRNAQPVGVRYFHEASATRNEANEAIDRYMKDRKAQSDALWSEPPRTATQAAASAAVNTGKGLLDAIDGLGKLFGSNGSRLSSGLTFDEETYAKAKPLFAQAVAHFKDAGADLKEAMRAVVRLVLDKFGPQVTENMRPYIVRFMEDVKAGNVVYDGSKEASNEGIGNPDGKSGSGRVDVGADAAAGERPGRDTQAGNDQQDRGDGTGRAGRGEPLDAMGQPDEGAGSGGQVAAGDRGRGDKLEGGQGVRGTEQLDGGNRNPPAVRNRPDEPATGGVAKTSKAPSTEGVSVSGKSDFQITDEDRLGEGGQKTKARNNLAAIRVAKKLEAEDRKATPAEQKVLAKYVGWGGIKPIFDDAKADWTKERTELKGLLSDTEYAEARRSMLAAHYTSTDVVSGMWAAAQHLGFTGGRVLEPSVGVGNFFGLMPADVRAKSQLFAVEWDKITSLIAKHLYPSAHVANAGFQDIEFPANSFDLVIGNPPFGKETLYDKNHPELRSFSIHNFFFAKSIDKVRPGGVLQMVVSRHLMDAIDSTARDYLAERADLIGAIRLPDSAFKANAGTDVVTDIIFLQKREPGAPRKGFDWSGTGTVTTTHPKTGETFDFNVNSYFVAHPEMIIGNQVPTGKMNNAPNQYNVEARDGESLFQGMGKALANLPKDIITPYGKAMPELVKEESAVPEGTKVYGYYMAGNTVMQRLPDAMDKRQGQPVPFKDEKAPLRAAGMIDIRNALRNLMRAELAEGTPLDKLNTMRARLNTLYDNFQKKYGYINQPSNRRAFRDDPDLPLLESLEPEFDAGLGADAAKKRGEAARKPSAKRADIFTKRVLEPFHEVTSADSAPDALIASLNAHGGVDPDYMSELYGRPWDQIKAELGALVFHNPNGGWETADEYLSGNVKAKLKLAEAAAEANPDYLPNVEALRAVIPADMPWSKISLRLGSPWIPSDVMERFAADLWGDKGASIKFVRQVAKWSVKSDGGDETARKSTWGVTYTKLSGGAAVFSASDVMEAIANNRAVVIKENLGSSEQPNWVNNDRATEAIRAKIQDMAAKFKEWIWEDEGRRERLATIYNENYNTDRRRVYDGSHLTLPGSSPNIQLRKHQKNGVWRAITDRVILLDQVVGAGKTFEMAAIAMELRRLGIARKPMFAVPNSLVKQWRDEFYKLYPNANVLAATEADFAKANRKRFFAKIATGDWDAVIVAHSSFKKVGMPVETEARILKEQLDEISDAIEQLKRDRGDRNIVRDMEKIKIRLSERMKALKDSGGKKDDLLSFDELGIDGLFVDEAHLFKNLFYYSQMRNVTGLGNPNGSGRAFDLFVKTQYLSQRYNNKALIGFATGTPVSNSLVEMFTMQRYLAWDKLKEQGLHLLDAWAGVYGDVQQVYEVHPSGTGYRLSTRFAKFVNLPSLMELYRSFADVVTMDDLKQQAKEAGGVFPIPKIKGGRPRNIVADRSEQQTRFFGVPEFGRDDKGNIAFKYPADLKVRKSDKDGKWYPWLPDGSKVGNEGFETEAEALAERDTLVRLPSVGWNSGSILWKFENLKKLTKDSKGKVNALSITNEARKAGLDFRLIDPAAPDFKGSKINIAVGEIVRIHKEWTADRGAQLVFCDLSVPKSARAAAASKERTAYVRGPDGLMEVKATVVTIEGVEASFLAVKRGGKGAEGGYVLYDGFSGAHTGIAEHQKKDAVDALKAKIESDGLGWLEDLQDRYGEITDADIADYKDAQGKEEEAAEEGADDTISMSELLALSGGNQFSVYDDIRTKLIANGIPEKEIAFIHDYDTATKKNELFKKVRSGEIRVLLGSTEKMGAGMNVQERLVALHHLDAPWRPSDLEQREGRIVRQGNSLYKRNPDGFEVEIMRYGTKQTYDTRMWQIIEHKAAGVEQLRKAGDDLLEIDDVGGEAANAADMKAAASGNPLILDEIKLRNEVKSLEAQQFAYAQARATMQDKVRWYRGAPDRAEDRIAEVQPYLDAADKNPAEPFAYTTADGKIITDKKNVATPISTAFVEAAKAALGETINAGTYRGLLLRLRKTMGGVTAYLGRGERPLPAADYGIEDNFSPSGFFTRLDNAFDRVRKNIEAERASAKAFVEQIPKLEAEIAKPFAREDALKDARARHREIVSKLQKSGGGIELSATMRVELDDAIAARNGKKAMESRATAPGTEPTTESARIVQSIVNKFKAQFKGSEALTIRVVRTAQDIPARFRPSPFAEGVFHDDAGLIYLVTMNLKHLNGQVNAARVWQVLMHEAVGHFGLAKMMGPRFAGILKQVQQAATAKGEVTEDTYQPGDTDYATMEAVRLRYPEASDEEVAQEVLARMAETDPGRTLLGYVRAVVRQWLRDMARAMGFDLDVTTAELNDLVAQASAYMRRGDNLAGDAVPSGIVAASQKVGAGATVVPTSTIKIGKAFSSLVDTLGRDDVSELLMNWNDSELSNDGTKIILFPGRDRRQSAGELGGSVKVGKAEFLSWLHSDAPLDPAVFDVSDEWRAKVEAARKATGLNPEKEVGAGEAANDRSADWITNEVKSAIQRWNGKDVAKAAPPSERAAALRDLNAALSDSSMSDNDRHRLAFNLMAKAESYAPSSGKFGGTENVSPLVAAMRKWSPEAVASKIAGMIESAPDNTPVRIGGLVYTPMSGNFPLVEIVRDTGGLVGTPDRNAARDAILEMLREDSELLADSVRDLRGVPSNPSILESRRAPGATQPKNSRRGLLDTALRKLGGEAAAKITGPAYDKLTTYLGGKIPEGIKAGVVSDFGLDEAYVDRRTELQTEQQKSARKTKSFVEALMTLDRAQSRVAYQWLNNRGAEADRLMAQLPEESKRALEDIKRWIAELTVEAVRLGQLDAETASRNFLAYLHRSYAKYDLNTDDKTWKAERAKAIKILGDQYKGRGLKMDVDPDRIHSAPGWWKDEMKGKRVKVLKNDAGRFAFVAEGTAIPPNYAGYKIEGVWEIRARKAGNRITLWRDFTQEERQMMGELDEAKYAVARTLFMMTRDIEVGRFHEWVADEYAKLPEDADADGVQMAEPSESMMRAFRTDEWVTVPTAKIPGTGVFKFGALAGMVVPGPVWNDIRQISAGRFEPFGAAYASILRAWKLSKTALTPTTHVNNIMGNFVMADMHDVGARDVIGAVRLMLAASNGDKDAQAILDRFEDSGATQGMFTTHELKKEVLEPLLKALREEVGMVDDEGAILKASAILSLALHGKVGEAVAGAKAAVKQSAVGRGVGAVVTKAQDYYQAEDALFRFAAFLKGVEDGKTDRESGKAARKAFLDYHINAPWINAMRGTAMPFIAFAYRAIPMLIETAAKKPWKVAKYMLVAGGLNALAYAMLGADGDEDKERAYLPEEKAGRLWGIVPKLIRMPWNRESTLRDGRKTSDPVFLDVRRWIPVGDVVDYGQDKTALPLIPQPLMPGGPLILAAEFLVNTSAFTGKDLTKETDTWVEKAAKVGGHFYKGFAPNLPIPSSGTWAGTKIDNAIKGKEDPLGRAYPVPEAIASGFGLKLERYPVDTLQRNAVLDMKGKLKELSDEQRQAARDYGRHGMTKVELDEKVSEIVDKKNKAVEEYKAKERRAMGRTAP